MRHGRFKTIGFQLFIQRCFTAPARCTTGQIGFAVAVGIKQFGQLRVFQLFDIGDVIFLSGFLIDKPALRSTGHVSAFAIKDFVATGGFVHFIMQRRPVDGGELRIPCGKRGVADVVIDFARWLNVVAQFFQRLAHQFSLEGFFADGALNRRYADAFAR